jgi:hypothetical protein
VSRYGCEMPGASRVAALIAAALPAACATDATACTAVPQTIATSQLLTSATTLRVHKGALVFAVIVEPEKYELSANPRTFPWLTPTARGALRTVQLCPDTSVTTLRRTVTAFRATRAGTSTVTAGLAPAWRSVAGRPHPFRATVTVLA